MLSRIKKSTHYLCLAIKTRLPHNPEHYVLGSNISAEVILDSSKRGVRVTTMVLKYPRFIHCEFMTHRIFSRNCASSRAISINQNIHNIIVNPAEPVTWGKDKPGMKSTDAYSHESKTGKECEGAWLMARNQAIESAITLQKLGLHKQIVNRVLEPFQMMTTIVTSTEWENFFSLRIAEDAQPEIKSLAMVMKVVLDKSIPVKRDYNDWHLPFLKRSDYLSLAWRTLLDNGFDLKYLSAARCARVSYLKHDGKASSVNNDIKLTQKLLKSRHMSPFEHQAKFYRYNREEYESNLTGVGQYRKMLEHGSSKG